MSDAWRQIWSIILLSIAGLLGVGLLYIIFLYIKENYIKIKDTKRENINSWNHKNLVKSTSFFQKKMRLLFSKNRFKIFLFIIVMGLIGWIVSIFADWWQFLIWGMIPIILIVAWIRSMTHALEGSFGGFVVFCVFILILGLFKYNSPEEIVGYLVIILVFLKWPLIILAILSWLYGLVRFIKWAWRD